MDTDINAAAQRLLHECDLYEPDDTTQYIGDLDSSLPHFEDDIRLVATWALGASEDAERMRAALEAMTESSDRLLRERDQYMDRVGVMLPALESIVQILGTHNSHRRPACMSEALRIASAALSPSTVTPKEE